MFVAFLVSILLNPALTQWTAPAHLPPACVQAEVQLWSPAGKAGEGGNPVSGYVRRASGASGSYVSGMRTICPGQVYDYQVGLGGSQQDTFFGGPLDLKATASLNNGQVGTGHVGDVVRPGVPATAGFQSYSSGQPGPGAPGPDGPGLWPTSITTGGAANGGVTPGGTYTHGTSNLGGGSGAGPRPAAEGNGPGKDGGDPAGAPSAGRGQGQPSGQPGDGAIVVLLPD